MSDVIFEKASEYLQTCTTLDTKIEALDAIITQLLTASATAAESGHLDEYWFDDGHVKIRNKYRSAEHMMESVKGFEQLRNYYVNQKLGRNIRLMDQSNFFGRW